MDNPTDRCGGKFRQLVTTIQGSEVRYKCNVCAEIINDSLLDYNLEQHFLRCGKSPCPEVLPGKEDEPSATFQERLRSARRTTLAVRQQQLGDSQSACNNAENSRTRRKEAPAVSQRQTSRQCSSRPSRKASTATVDVATTAETRNENITCTPKKVQETEQQLAETTVVENLTVRSRRLGAEPIQACSPAISRPRRKDTPAVTQRTKSHQTRSRQPHNPALANATTTENEVEETTVTKELAALPPQQNQVFERQVAEKTVAKNVAVRHRRPLHSNPENLDQICVDHEQVAEPSTELSNVHSKFVNFKAPQVVVTGPPGTAETPESLENAKKSMLQKEKSQSPTYITTTSTSGNAYTYHFGDCMGDFYFISPHQDAPSSPHIPVQQPPPQKHGQLAVPNRPHSASIIMQVPLPKRPPIYVDFPTTRVVISGLPRLQAMEESREVDQLLWTLKKVAESESFDPSRHVQIRSYPEEDKWVVNVPNEDCAEAIHAWVLRHRFMGCDLRACYEQVVEVKDFN